MRTYMTEKVAAQFKKLLLARRLELSRRLVQTQDEAPSAAPFEAPRPGDSDHPTLAHQGTEGQGMLMAMDAALARIAGGSFGECMTCGEEIGFKRLVAFPWTRCCPACQDTVEKHQ